MAKATTNIIQNNIIKGLQTDLNDTLVDEQILTHHRNGMFQTHNGDIVFATREPSTLKCIDLPYKYNGHIKLKNERYLVFSSDNIESEIGIADTNKCEYTRVANNNCFSFDNNYLISGFVRINVNGEEEVIFVDGKNPDRYINLSNLPYTYTIDEDTECEVKVYTNNLDCEELRLNPNIKIPCISVAKKNQGNLPNGMFSVAIAYLVDTIKFSDYYSLTTPTTINRMSGDSSLSLNISNLDRNFDKYQILLTGAVNGTVTSKIIGTYPTSQENVVISDWINENYQDGIPASSVVSYKINYDSADILAANSQYLMRADIKRKTKINYQPQAFNIKAEYIVYQVPISYYKENGENIGYWRDENYNFVIRHFWYDGEPTEHTQIAGRVANSLDLSIATGQDVFELSDDESCETLENLKEWSVFNTAGQMVTVNNDFKCNARVVGYGELGYHESTDTYGDSVEIFGENACKPIRYHRFPDECKVPRYTIINGETYVNILGIRFSGIERPKDASGKVIPGIIGYEILRSERDEANKTIKSRGIITNMQGYTDINNRKNLFSNFPFNSLEPNTYLSSTQTYKKNNKEFNYKPLSTFYNDKFTYYTPHGNYFGRERLSNYFQIETEEYGNTEGFFERVWNHPEHKLLTNFSYWMATLLGVIQAYLELNGKVCKTKASIAETTTVVSGTPPTASSVTVAGNRTLFEKCDSLWSKATTNLEDIKDVKKPQRILLSILQTVANVAGFTLLAATHAKQWLDIIKNFSGYTQFAYQYNGVVNYTNQKCVSKGNRRRSVLRQPFYLDNGFHSVGDFNVNNGGRNSSVFVEFNKEIAPPTIKDTSRKTLSELNKLKNPLGPVNAVSSVFYVTNKQSNPNQYNTISNVKPVKIHNCIKYYDNEDLEETYSTGELFGGDCIIYMHSHLNKFPIFRQNIAGANYPPGMEYDYRNYNNVGYARYWFDSTEFNMGGLLNLIGKTTPTQGKLPNQKFNLDGGKPGSADWVIENQYMYLYVNGVFNYVAEADYNIAFRENQQEGEGNNLYQPHYSKEQTNLSYIFRSDLIVKPENFSLDSSYKFLSQNLVFSTQLTELPKANIREKNSISYSLPSFNTQGFNNWRYFLPNNYFTFDERDYGRLTGIHALDQDRVVFLFSAASPFISMGRDQLETLNGRNITIGDGGLFAQMPREMMHTDVAYGSNHDQFAFSSTQFGYFYVSRKQGKIFNLSNQLDEISRQGVHKWCAKYMPLNMEKDFPDYPFTDNPATGVGYLIAFDNVYETIYISKRDYKVKDKYKPNITFDVSSNNFLYNDISISLQDTEYFQDASWTLSYHAANKVFQSWHDWHPDDIIQEERHFISLKDNGLWKHNERCDSYNVYYGVEKPYEIEFAVSTGSAVNILQSIEFEQEAYEYRNECRDKYHNYFSTFTNATIYNSEQTSGLIEFVDTTNTKRTHYNYPLFTSNYKSTIPLVKVENKFRFNEFRDYTDDRGRNGMNQRHIFNVNSNGYERFLNPPNIDFKQKYAPRFRHYFNKVWFAKIGDHNINLITKFSNVKLQISSR
jgi:hypothetical protein